MIDFIDRIFVNSEAGGKIARKWATAALEPVATAFLCLLFFLIVAPITFPLALIGAWKKRKDKKI